MSAGLPDPSGCFRCGLLRKRRAGGQAGTPLGAGRRPNCPLVCAGDGAGVRLWSYQFPLWTWAGFRVDTLGFSASRWRAITRRWRRSTWARVLILLAAAPGSCWIMAAGGVPSGQRRPASRPATMARTMAGAGRRLLLACVGSTGFAYKRRLHHRPSSRFTTMAVNTGRHPCLHRLVRYHLSAASLKRAESWPIGHQSHAGRHYGPAGLSQRAVILPVFVGFPAPVGESRAVGYSARQFGVGTAGFSLLAHSCSPSLVLGGVLAARLLPAVDAQAPSARSRGLLEARGRVLTIRWSKRLPPEQSTAREGPGRPLHVRQQKTSAIHSGQFARPPSWAKKRTLISSPEAAGRAFYRNDDRKGSIETGRTLDLVSKEHVQTQAGRQALRNQVMKTPGLIGPERADHRHPGHLLGRHLTASWPGRQELERKETRQLEEANRSEPAGAGGPAASPLKSSRPPRPTWCSRKRKNSSAWGQMVARRSRTRSNNPLAFVTNQRGWCCRRDVKALADPAWNYTAAPIRSSRSIARSSWPRVNSLVERMDLAYYTMQNLNEAADTIAAYGLKRIQADRQGPSPTFARLSTRMSDY